MKGASTVEHRFEALFDAQVIHVRRYATTLVSFDRVDDVVQACFITAWERFERIPPDAERAWLFGVLRNHCRNMWRSQRRADALIALIQHTCSAVAVELANFGLDPVEIAPLLLALAELDDDECELLVMTGWLEMTPSEIATVLDEPSGTTRVRLSRVRSKLRARFAEIVEDGELR